jgi:hypothetical protein
MASKDFTTESRAGGTRSRSDHHSTQSRAIVALSALVGFAAGAATVHGLHAQSQPPGYAVIELDVQQPEEFEKEFVPLATKAVTDQHGKFLAKFGPTRPSKVTRRNGPPSSCSRVWTLPSRRSAQQPTGTH